MTAKRDPAPPQRQITGLVAAGLVLLFAAFVYWIVTGNQSQLFVGAALSVIGIDAGREIRVTIKRGREAEDKERSSE